MVYLLSLVGIDAFKIYLLKVKQNDPARKVSGKGNAKESANFKLV